MNISLELTRTIPESYNSPFENTDATRFAFWLFFYHPEFIKTFFTNTQSKKTKQKIPPYCFMHYSRIRQYIPTILINCLWKSSFGWVISAYCAIYMILFVCGCDEWSRVGIFVFWFDHIWIHNYRQVTSLSITTTTIKFICFLHSWYISALF